MHITTISYERNRNLGNYESERISAEAIVDEGEDPAQVYSRLRANLLWMLYPENREQKNKPSMTAQRPDVDDLPF